MWRLLLALVLITAQCAFAAKTLYGQEKVSSGKTLFLNSDAEAGDENEPISRVRRDTPQPVITNSTVRIKVTHLNDSHKQMMVHWVGEGSNVVICLSKDPTPPGLLGMVQPSTPSSVFISYDYGDTYQNKTELFKLPNGSYAILDKFYNHPKYNTHFVFTDLRNRIIHVTSDHGRTFKSHPVHFSPSEIAFHEYLPLVFAVLDKDDPNRSLWITENFGQTFRRVQMFVKSFFWLDDGGDYLQLLVQRIEPNGFNTIGYSSLENINKETIYDTNVKDFYVKENYLFTTKIARNGKLELYFSYKLKNKLKCVFDSALEAKSYYIVDVSANRALVAVSHNGTLSHLYVSDDLTGKNGEVHFTLSLEGVFSYFPNSTWNESFLSHVSEEAFADVYKVEPITGIYIASQVVSMPQGHNIGPQHIATVITFDHGATWRHIVAPQYDNRGQPTGCDSRSNCSLHLSQKFMYYYPDARMVGILSSKSAPGLIVATGVMGRNLKGHYGVYVSSDAGVTWHQALKELFFFNMGDHGGVLTAVKYFHGQGNAKTRNLMYSTDEGETWSQAPFYKEDIRLYGLMTEPGENTTVFTMFGSAPAVHQWIIIKVDLRGVFSYNCSKDDYKTWSPGQDGENRSYIPCVMGQQLTYQRRMPHSNCYNGLDYDIPVSMKPCSCDALDFECDFGFMRFGNPPYCVRNKSMSYDPYEIPKTCKPGGFYNRTKGYRKIAGDVCEDGFEKHYLPDVLPCPFKEVPHFLLFAHRDKISRFDLITNQVEDLPIADLKNVIALDFDMRNNCVYWADIVLDTINRQCLNNGSKPEVLVSNDLASVEGLAYDWLSHNLYFVDGTRAKIELIRTDIHQWGRMRRTILDQKQLRKPRGIALHPPLGLLFWSDWNSENPSISRANLDGSSVRTLFGKQVVEWPNGITVDFIASRIYWVDGKRDYIASSDLHGDYFKIIISKYNVVSHPFAIAVFKDLMYWDDWKNNAIYVADKDQVNVTNQIETLYNKQQPGLMDLKVFAHSLQEGKSACSSSAPCAFICTTNAPGGQQCLCPDGMVWKDGKCLCPGNVAPLNMTCPRLDNTCSPEHTSCANGACIPKGWRCDGEDDCGDNSDEVDCNSEPCEKNLHRCADGKCIPHYWKCDFERDCIDGSDEMNCPKQNCTSEQFACRNGRCISSRWKCDRENDCADGSDEEGCDMAEPTDCKTGEFTCITGGVKCIPATWKCDGESDCRDNSDELNCANNTCLDTQFSCGPPTNRCIHKSWVCDGDLDCKNGNDEMNCTTTAKPTSTPKPSFESTNGTCHSWMFTCANKKCIPNWWRCDTADDCGDNSDELDCDNSFPSANGNKSPDVGVCSDNHYQCNTGECIKESWVCDGQKDCPNGDDEVNCGVVTKCTTSEFKCRIDSSCIPLNHVCNQINDCPDGSDEAFCDQNFPAPDPATASCSRGFYPCDVNSCYPLATLCDGKRDCIDAFDESNCTAHTHRIYQVLQMGIEDLGITDHSLRLYWWIATPRNESLEFLPSVGVVGEEERWRNGTWIGVSEYVFEGLEAYTLYNMTVYVRVRGTNEVFPPAKYFTATTKEGVPGPPLNLTVQQQNGSHVLLSWQHPAITNGPIQYYEISYSPPYPPVQVQLNDNGTAHLLTVDFEPGESYSFYVVAHNQYHDGEKSDVKTIEYDKDLAVTRILNLDAIDSSNSSISLKWQYEKTVDHFKIAISAERPYPMLPDQISYDTAYNITGLAPGVTYTIAVSAVLKTLTGPESYVSTSTLGAALPEIGTPETMVIKDIGTSVKLSWNPLKDMRKRTVHWIYGVYYGLNEDELLESAKLNTTDFTATVSGLYACENYLFGVGVIGPYGVGPVSHLPANVRTYASHRAPPKALNVECDRRNDLVIGVFWSPSCAAARESLDYVISVYERITKKTTNILHQNCIGPTCNHTFTITYGAIYDIKLKTNVHDSKYSPTFTYTAPPVLPPVEISVSPKANGSYILSWKERVYKKEIGSYSYEVLVSEGPFNESTAQAYKVLKPPFVYSNVSSNNYTFALRVKTSLGYESSLSPRYGAIVLQGGPAVPGSLGGANLTAILVPTLLLVMVLSIVLVMVIVRHQRLQNSFTRFANSHYDTRSGAATFDDHGELEEEETPQIRGFSDDEPLVIA